MLIMLVLLGENNRPAVKNKVLLILSLTPGVVLQLLSGRIKTKRITQLVPECRIENRRCKSNMRLSGLINRTDMCDSQSGGKVLNVVILLGFYTVGSVINCY